MKALIYLIIVVVPSTIIGTTVYLTRTWPPHAMSTMVVWFIAWLVSMVLVTILYLKLMPLTKRLSADEDDDEDESVTTKSADKADQ